MAGHNAAFIWRRAARASAPSPACTVWSSFASDTPSAADACAQSATTRTSKKPHICWLYTPGHYTTNINVKDSIALFDPGLYYLDNGLTLDSGSTVRAGTGAGDGSGGVIFYFSGSGTVTVNSNSGGTFDNFNSVKGPVDSSGNKYADKTTAPALRNQTYGNGASSGDAMTRAYRQCEARTKGAKVVVLLCSGDVAPRVFD